MSSRHFVILRNYCAREFIRLVILKWPAGTTIFRLVAAASRRMDFMEPFVLLEASLPLKVIPITGE